jgi:hypothetical protein
MSGAIPAAVSLALLGLWAAGAFGSTSCLGWFRHGPTRKLETRVQTAIAAMIAAFAASTALWFQQTESSRLTLKSNVLWPLTTAFLLKPSRAADARPPLSGTRRDSPSASLAADSRSAGPSGRSWKGFVGVSRGLPKAGSGYG